MNEKLQQKLFNHMSNEHDLSLLETELREIYEIFKPFIKEKLKEQKMICSEQGKHFKFGTYNYRKDKMIHAPEPEL